MHYDYLKVKHLIPCSAELAFSDAIDNNTILINMSLAPLIVTEMPILEYTLFSPHLSYSYFDIVIICTVSSLYFNLLQYVAIVHHMHTMGVCILHFLLILLYCRQKVYCRLIHISLVSWHRKEIVSTSFNKIDMATCIRCLH
jgi:hypothetical protein